MLTKIESNIIEVDKKFQHLCKRKYRGHPKGCPNYGKKPGCPPGPLLDEVFDLNKEMCVLYTEYAVGERAEIMKQNPKLKTPGQWYNSRYWQDAARSQHAKEILADAAPMLNITPDRLLRLNLNIFFGLGTVKPSERKAFFNLGDLVLDKTPEARGVNVTDLMQKLGIELRWGQWPPPHSLDNTTYVVSLLGHPL